ncbi:MAG: hypothetical protein RIA63_05110 [Cyclobacteriaceae bacterium]
MYRYYNSAISCLLLVLLISCYVSKPLDTQTRVKLDENIPIKINKEEGARFVENFGEADYRKAFLDGMKLSLGYDNVVIDDANPQFIITFAELEILEIATTDTVKDEKSQDNGRIFEIAEAKLKVSGTLVNVSDQKSITWSADKDKSERITSLQNPSQIIKGENKDLNEYRRKDFDKGEFVELSGQCGRRAATVIVNNIRRQLN